MKVAPRHEPLPLNCDLRQLVGPLNVYNQGELRSCTANAIAGAYKIMTLLKNKSELSISRLFVYYNERIIIGKVYEDSGAFIKDGMLSMQTQGACLEEYWPYNERQFSTIPPQICYNEARLHRTSGYNAQLDPSNMVHCPLSNVWH